jgi:hypothetical protein
MLPADVQVALVQRAKSPLMPGPVLEPRIAELDPKLVPWGECRARAPLSDRMSGRAVWPLTNRAILCGDWRRDGRDFGGTDHAPPPPPLPYVSCTQCAHREVDELALEGQGETLDGRACGRCGIGPMRREEPHAD